jgi:4-hydroxy-2-oxoheptanedioate aldolase
MTSYPTMPRLKKTWADGAAALGLWVSSDSGSVAEILATQDVDYLNIDMQHGLVDYSSAVDVMRALSATNATITCRVPWNEPGIIGKVLDAGAMGVIIPMVNTVDQARAAVAACRYAPLGSRSHGPIRAAQVNGPDYPATANARVACIPMIETTEAMSNLDAILDVPGIDAVYIGPADLRLTLGLPPAGDHDDAAFTDALDTVVAACDKRGIIAGIHANPGLTQKRLTQGFRMVTVSSDLVSLASGLAADLAAARSAVSSTGDGALY